MSARGALGQQWAPQFEHTGHPHDLAEITARHPESGEVAGILTYYEDGPQNLHAEGLEVGQAHQRKGVATALHDELARRYPEHTVTHDLDSMTPDAHALGLHLDQHQPGRHIYRRMGGMTSA